MKNGKSETVILITVTALTLAAVFFVFLNKPAYQYQTGGLSATPAVNRGTGEQILYEPDASIDAGLYLDVVSPADKASVSYREINVSGKTGANADVFINEKELKADPQGNFSIPLILEEGDNIIVVTASDAEGNYSEKTLTVTYELTE